MAYWYQQRQHKGLTLAEARQQALQPLLYANLMVAMGYADGSVNGAITSTAEVVRAALQVIGCAATTASNTIASSFFLMLPNDARRPMLFADCALNIDPNAEQLATIAAATISSANSLLDATTKVAMLSFSTAGSASHPLVHKVIEATALLKQRPPGYRCGGVKSSLMRLWCQRLASKKSPNQQYKVRQTY